MMALFCACGQNPNSQPTQKPNEPPAALPNAGEPQFDYDYNPLTGLALPEGFEKGQRPVAIMINNSAAAMPQRGVGSADVIYEMVTEGGVTRLMALFADRRTIPQTGPVRSARDQHLQLCLPTNSIFVHIGSSIYASNLLNEQKYQDIDGMFLGSTSFVYDETRSLTYANEHCWYTDSALIGAGIERNAVPLQGSYSALFSFLNKDEAKRVPAQGVATDMQWNYSAVNDASFVYIPESGVYIKNVFGAAHIDELTGGQLNFSNVILLLDNVTLKSDNICTDFEMNEGTGYYFSAGAYEEIKWKKGAPAQSLKLFAKDGTELKVNTGKSYVGIIGKEQAHTVLANAVPIALPPVQAPAVSSSVPPVTEPVPPVTEPVPPVTEPVPPVTEPVPPVTEPVPPVTEPVPPPA